METVEFGVPVHGGGRKEEQDGTKTPCLFFVVGLVVPTPPKLKLRPFGNFLGDYRGPCTAPSAECNLEGWHELSGQTPVQAAASRGQSEVWSQLTLRWRGGNSPAIWISDSKGWGSLWIGLDKKISETAKFCDNSLPSANRATELSLFDRRATVQ